MRINEEEEKQRRDDEDEDFVDDNYPSELDESDEDKEDYTIRASDSLIVAAVAENDYSNLEGKQSK